MERNQTREKVRYLLCDRHSVCSDYGCCAPGLMVEWDARTPRQVYRHQRGIARYWEHGTEPDVLSPEFHAKYRKKKN